MRCKANENAIISHPCALALVCLVLSESYSVWITSLSFPIATPKRTVVLLSEVSRVKRTDHICMKLVEMNLFLSDCQIRQIADDFDESY